MRYGRRSKFPPTVSHSDVCLLVASPSDLELRLGGAPVTLNETDLIQSLVRGCLVLSYLSRFELKRLTPSILL